MKILFVTSNRLGDAVLSNSALSWLIETYPQAELTIVCGPLAASLYQHIPNLDRVIELKKEKRSKHWVKFWKQTVGTKWDLIVDLRNSLATRLLRRSKLITHQKPKVRMHKVDEFAQLLNVKNLPNPRLWLAKSERDEAKQLMGETQPILGVGPIANWIGKQWEIEKFIALIEKVRSEEGFLPNAKIAVFAAPNERAAAQPLLDHFGDKIIIDLIGKTSPQMAGACLELCDFYIGNDSGLMHLSCAVGTKTLGLFGPSYPEVYGPRGDHTAIARTEKSFDELIDFEGYTPQSCGCLMTDLSIETVYQTAQNLWDKSYV